MGSRGGEEQLEVAGESGEYPVRFAAWWDPHRGSGGGRCSGRGGIEDGDADETAVDGECAGDVAGRDYGFEC